MNEANPLENDPVLGTKAMKSLRKLPEMAETELLDPLMHGQNRSDWTCNKLVFEQPWHKQALILFATGMGVGEVAEACDMGRSQVGSLLKEAWFQSKLTALIEKNGGKDILNLFKAEAINSLNTIVELRDNEEVSPMVRCTCAKDILDRVLGKPKQTVESHTTVTSSDPVEEVKALQQELEIAKHALKMNENP